MIDEVEGIAAAAAAADGAAPLDEATWLALRHHPERVRSWVRADGFALVIGADLSLVVHPDARGQGLGTALLEEALAETTAETPPEASTEASTGAWTGLEAWSHGDHPAAAALARSHGFERVRELWVMRRALGSAGPGLPELRIPDGLTVRGYRPGSEDAEEVLRVNAAAFAHHPEQGSMDAANLAERMAEPWFDPAGLLLATEPRATGGERVLGFHWTKQHPAPAGADPGPGPGEVYVVGIDPAAQGRGLGKALTLAGLHHLAGRGVREVLLYVESDNRPAIAVYAGLGFTHADDDTHVRYRRGAS